MWPNLTLFGLSKDLSLLFYLQEFKDTAVMTCTKEGDEPADNEEKIELPSSPNNSGRISMSGSVSEIP